MGCCSSNSGKDSDKSGQPGAKTDRSSKYIHNSNTSQKPDISLKEDSPINPHKEYKGSLSVPTAMHLEFTNTGNEDKYVISSNNDQEIIYSSEKEDGIDKREQESVSPIKKEEGIYSPRKEGRIRLTLSPRNEECLDLERISKSQTPQMHRMGRKSSYVIQHNQQILENSAILKASLLNEQSIAVAQGYKSVPPSIHRSGTNYINSPEQKKTIEHNSKISNSTGEEERQGERAMLIKYVLAWNELANSYQREDNYIESLQCFQSAALIYDTLQMYPHLAISLGQFFFGFALNLLDTGEDILQYFTSSTPGKGREGGKIEEFLGQKYFKIVLAIENLRKVGISEMNEYFIFFEGVSRVFKGQYSAAKECFEACYSGLEEVTFFKALIYYILDVTEAQEICYKTMSSEYQRKYTYILKKTAPNNYKDVFKEIFQQFSDNPDLNFDSDFTFHESKSFFIKEILINGSCNYKRFIYDYVNIHFDIYGEADLLKRVIVDEKELEKCLVLLGHIVRVWLLLPVQALFFYDQAVQFKPNYPTPLFFIGVTLRSLGRPWEAIEAYEKALSIHPAFPECYFNIGNIYMEELGDVKSAKNYYKEALVTLLEIRTKKEESAVEGDEGSLLNIGRVLNLLSEISKEEGDNMGAIDSYLQGINLDIYYLDNYTDISQLLLDNKYSHLAEIFSLALGILDPGDLKLEPTSQSISHLFRVIGVEIRKGNSIQKEVIDKCLRGLQSAFRILTDFDENSLPNNQNMKILEYFSRLSELKYQTFLNFGKALLECAQEF